MKINLGSGACGQDTFFGKGKGWTCVDFSYTPELPEWQQAEYMKYDICIDPWPLAEESVECIFASHIFEHIVYDKLLVVARQCHRVLQVGHPIRIICPDPRIFLKNWSIKNRQHLKDCFGEENYQRWAYENQLNMAFTDMFFNEHYDHHVCATCDLIMVMLVKAGFSQVTEMAYCNTAFPQYYGAYEATLDNRPVMSYYIEAVK